MSIVRPFFPYDTIDVLDVQKAAYLEFCDWNLKMNSTACNGTSTELVQVFCIAEFLPIKYNKKTETEQDGFGTEYTEVITVDRIFSFETIADELVSSTIHSLLYGAKEITLTNTDNESITAYDFDIDQNEISDGLYKLKIEYKAKDDYHGQFGLSGCCLPIFEGAPYENPCDGTIQNPSTCVDVDIYISRVNDMLVSNVSGTTAAYTISWYFRNSNGGWTLLLANANSIEASTYGEYRAIMNLPGCGNFVANYIIENPCTNWNVTIIRTGDILTAQLPATFPGVTFDWFKNTGSGWQLLSETSNALIISETADYRVNANLNGCTAIDVISANFNPCNITAALNWNNGRLGIVTNCTDSPEYNWLKDVGNGNEAYDVNVVSYGPFIYPTQTGLYTCELTCGDGCFVSVSKLLIIENTNAQFDVAITRSGLILTLVTDAVSPYTIQWAVEEEGGFTNLGTASTQTISNTGNYHVTVTKNGVSKSAYLFCLGLESASPNPNGGGCCPSIDIESYTTGTTFDFPISWVITDLEKDIIVFRNGVKLSLVENPTTTLEYGGTSTGVFVSEDWPIESGDILQIIKLK